MLKKTAVLWQCVRPITKWHIQNSKNIFITSRAMDIIHSPYYTSIHIFHSYCQTSRVILFCDTVYIWRLYRLRDTGRKSRNFYTPPVFSAHAGGAPSDFAKMFDTYKSIRLKWLDYSVVKKLRRCVKPIAATWRTDRQNCYVNQYRASRALKNQTSIY